MKQPIEIDLGDRPGLPLRGQIVGVFSVLWGLWVCWIALGGSFGTGLFAPITAIALLVHAVIVISAILFLQRKGIGRQLLVVGHWCSAAAMTASTLFVSALAIGFGGLIDSVGGGSGETDWGLLLILLGMSALPAIAAITLHHRAVREAMGPPWIGVIRRNGPNLRTRERGHDE